MGQVDRLVQKLGSANIAFNVPTSTLTVGDSEVVQLLLSARESIRRLQKQITALGEKRGFRIKASDFMQAHLVGSRFKIQAVIDEVQAVGGQRATEWKWEIEPTEAGTHTLHLTLAAIIKVDGSDRVFTVRTFQQMLVVRVTLVDRLSAFFGGNWQWLWGAILIPVAGWVVSRRRRRAAPAT